MLKACHRLNDVSSPNFYDEALIPNVAGLEAGPFKEISKTEEVIRVECDLEGTQSKPPRPCSTYCLKNREKTITCS